ncbi:MAG: ORF6N domain-containing protein [Methylacidiphilales bacterium]|nr:ORF6N domain-containing protein [Candidatus Methylacidiphilales bacterium]
MSKELVSKNLDHLILTIRKHRVLLDADLARLYGVETKQLNRAVKRNADRFPEDFMLQLTQQEADALRCQSGTSNEGRGGRRYLPYAFTQEGVAMLSSVLQSPRAVAVNIAIMRAFIRLRQMALSVDDLARKVESLERGFKQHGQQFDAVFKAIRQLMTPPPEPPRKKIGFNAD